jgi:hypothetical protein
MRSPPKAMVTIRLISYHTPQRGIEYPVDSIQSHRAVHDGVPAVLDPAQSRVLRHTIPAAPPHAPGPGYGGGRETRS